MQRISSPALSRRSLIAGSAAAFTGTALRPASAEQLAAVFDAPATAWKELRILLGEDLYLPRDAGFGWKMQVSNMRYMGDIPHAVAVCSSAEKAAAVIQWCAANSTPFRIKGGGHSYAGFSAGPYLILYTQGMDRVSWEGTRITAGGRGHQLFSLRRAGRQGAHNDPWALPRCRPGRLRAWRRHRL